MCIFVVQVSHWFQLLHYSKALSETLGGKGIYTVLGAISKHEVYRLVNTAESWGLNAQNWDIVTTILSWYTAVQPPNRDSGLTAGSASLW